MTPSRAFRLDALNGQNLKDAADRFEDDGYIVIEGVADSVTSHFLPIVAERMGLSATDMASVLDSNGAPMVLPLEVRQRLSRIETPPALGSALLGALSTVVGQLIGPIVHVSSTFHGHVKTGEAPAVDHGGYNPTSQFLEVQGQYLLHQDFTGASFPTSPCGITLWTPLNSCPNWNLRLYPGSHRLGLLCMQWLKLDDARLGAIGEAMDIEAKAGTAVIFNSLLLHSSSNPGPRRRVSCDIRFFPLCGFLPTTPTILDSRPLAAIRGRLAEQAGPTITEPLREVLSYLGNDVYDVAVRPHSILNWSNYLSTVFGNGADAALPILQRFVNEEQGVDRADAYIQKFHNRTMHLPVLEALHRRLAVLEPEAPELLTFGRISSRLAGAAA